MRCVLFSVILLCLACDQSSPDGNCEETECFRPYVCVESCGGPELSSSCCPCPEGQLDQNIDCRVPEG